MAHLTSCIYCGRNVLNNRWCPECRQAHVEGILDRVKKLINKGKLKDLPPGIKDSIIHDVFLTPQKLKKSRREETRRANERNLRDLARLEESQKHMREWDKKHPDPHPFVCAK